MRSDWESLDPAVLGLLTRLARPISRLPGAEHMVLYGSYAKGTNTEGSDVDLAVFFRGEKDPVLLEEYRSLARICASNEYDVQVQAFSSEELASPCGIVEEIDLYGVELPLFPSESAQGGRE
ncbi:MAG TPA: nucleotidyltransferase domain-containing protein [Clostridia bacterium]|nr:nucleotidyltransferase domain-containing protein [Clostridia bacterium]